MSTMDLHRPDPDQTTQGYWQAAADGRLLASWCLACSHVAHYPRPFCPECWSGDVRPLELSGRATLYTYSVVHVNPAPPFGDLVPYVAAIVDLEEGPRMMTRLVDVDEAEVRIGMPLQVTFERADDDEGVALFRPA
jgi:uncharacterized protein